jgi:hypothetical protein
LIYGIFHLAAALIRSTGWLARGLFKHLAPPLDLDAGAGALFD